jgi:hypothetical protein
MVEQSNGGLDERMKAKASEEDEFGELGGWKAGWSRRGGFSR